MGLLGGYLRLHVVVLTAVVLAVAALSVLTGHNTGLRLLVLLAVVVAGFAASALLLSFR